MSPIKCENIYESTKLSTQFLVKNRTKFEHRHNGEFFCHCLNVVYNKKCVGESDWWINECIIWTAQKFTFTPIKMRLWKYKLHLCLEGGF